MTDTRDEAVTSAKVPDGKVMKMRIRENGTVSDWKIVGRAGQSVELRTEVESTTRPVNNRYTPGT